MAAGNRRDWIRPLVWLVVAVLIGLTLDGLNDKQQQLRQQQQRLAEQARAWKLVEHWQQAAVQAEVNQSAWAQGTAELVGFWQQQSQYSAPFNQAQFYSLYLAQLTELALADNQSQSQLAMLLLEQQNTLPPKPSPKPDRSLRRRLTQSETALALLQSKLQLLEQRMDLQTSQLASQKMELLALKSAQLQHPKVATLSADLVGLFVDTLPGHAKVEVLNIRDRFTQGISLPEGKYLLRVSAPGFDTINRWVHLLPQQNRYCVALADVDLEGPGPGEHKSTIFEAPCSW